MLWDLVMVPRIWACLLDGKFTKRTLERCQRMRILSWVMHLLGLRCL